MISDNNNIFIIKDELYEDNPKELVYYACYISDKLIYGEFN